LNKLDYLKKYNKQIQIIELAKTNISNLNIPDIWKEVLSEQNLQKQIDLLFGYWNKHLGSELSNTIAYLRKNVINLDLLEHEGSYSLLYSVKIPRAVNYIMKVKLQIIILP
jgi:hypothetical protein